MIQGRGHAGSGRRIRGPGAAALLAGLIAPCAFADADSTYYRIGAGVAGTSRSANTQGYGVDFAAGRLFTPRKPWTYEVVIGLYQYGRAVEPTSDGYTTVEFSLLYKFNTSEKWDLYGRAGAHVWIWGDFLTVSLNPSSADKGLGLNYGLGIQNWVQARSAIRLEWQAYSGATVGEFSRATISWVHYR
jgi:hypothetical protein